MSASVATYYFSKPAQPRLPARCRPNSGVGPTLKHAWTSLLAQACHGVIVSQGSQFHVLTTPRLSHGWLVSCGWLQVCYGLIVSLVGVGLVSPGKPVAGSITVQPSWRRKHNGLALVGLVQNSDRSMRAACKDRGMYKIL